MPNRGRRKIPQGLVSIAPRASWPVFQEARAEKENEDAEFSPAALHARNQALTKPNLKVTMKMKARSMTKEDRRKQKLQRAEGQEEEAAPQKKGHEFEAPQKKIKLAKEAAEVDQSPKAKRALISEIAEAEVAAAEKALAAADAEWEAATDALSAASDVSPWWDKDVAEADTERAGAKSLKAARDAQIKMSNAVRKMTLGRHKLGKALKARSDLGYAVKAAPRHVRQRDIEAFLFPVEGSFWGRVDHDGSMSDGTQASNADGPQ